MFQPQASDAQSEGDRMSIMSGISGTGVIDREDRYSGNEGVASQPHWMWIAAGSCRIDPLQPPASWFVTQEAVSSQLSLAGEPWRVNILQVAREAVVQWIEHRLVALAHQGSIPASYQCFFSTWV